PQTSENFQFGTVYHGSHLSLDADVYFINFNNKFANKKVNGDKVFYNEGGVLYKGVEGQVTAWPSSPMPRATTPRPRKRRIPRLRKHHS
ncbi:MAG: TonB-dependent receptor, partial [Novosphingobium sp.]